MTLLQCRYLAEIARHTSLSQAAAFLGALQEVVRKLEG